MQTLNAQTGEGTSKQKVKQVIRSKQQTKNKQKFVQSDLHLFAQSGDGNPTHTEFLTRFYDNSEVHKPKEGEKKQLTGIPRLPRQGLVSTIDNFLCRPFIVSRFEWISTNAMRTQLFTLDFPNALLTVSTSLVEKLNKNCWWAPDIEVEVQINATKFHYGRMMLVVRPFQQTLNASYTTAQGASTWPEWYQISANSQQSVKITIPYRHFVRKVSISQNNVEFRNFSTLTGYVAAPLSSANDSTVAPVTVTVYARILNPNLSNFTHLNAQSGEQNAEVLQMLREGVTSLLPNQIGTVSAPISTTFNTISAVSKDIAQLSTVAGLSNPTNPNPTTSMQIRQPLFSKANDMPNSINLGPSQTVALQTNYALANATEDEMDIVNIVGHPSLLYTGQITTEQTFGSTLAQFYLTPNQLVYGDYTFTNAAGTVLPTPAYYISRLFNLWRGSFKIHISFISSSFHSCRVRFVWLPANPDAQFPVISTTNALNLYNVLMDINTQTDYSILIPYDQSVEWLRTNFTPGTVTVPGTSINKCNGYFRLILETELTSAQATVQPIFYQIFISMADDAQFAAPSTENLTTLGNPYLSEPAALLTKLTLNDNDDDLLAQTGETILECQVPSSSAFCLRDTKYISIMGEPLDTRRVYGESTVFEYTSVKQLSNMLTPMERYKTDDTEDFTGRQINPFGTMTFAYTDDQWHCLYNQIRSIYRFGRGSFRFVGIVDSAAIQATSYLRPGVDPGAGYFGDTTDDPYIGTVSNSVCAGGFQYFMSTQYMPADIIIPYYGVTPCYAFNSHPTNTSSFMLVCTAGNITFSTQKTVGLAIMFFGATSDDFIFGSRTGMPTVKFTPPV